tara:strand:- start:5171 stop:5302 length:132 start_codon:yes stop_codon:yes gene_type:complete
MMVCIPESDELIIDSGKKKGDEGFFFLRKRNKSGTTVFFAFEI